MKVQIISKFNAQSYPLNDTAIEISEETLSQIGISKCFDVENNCVIDYDNTEDLEEERKFNLRLKRGHLLSAFDIWEKAVLRGREEESQEVMKWYYDILDLDETAINNVPEKVKKYL